MRGCPRRNPNGGRCGAAFETMPPAPRTREPFTRPMTEVELGELQLLREWMRIPAGWVKDAEGRLWRTRPKPASWQNEEGAAKTIALWDILDCDPFPEPEGKPVRFDAGIGTEALDAEPERKRKKKTEESAVPIEPFRAAERKQQRQMREALEPDGPPEMEAAWWESVAGSDPPPGR